MADPAEPLDVLDELGARIGVERRDVVHRDGLWHRCFHLWVLSGDGVLLQRRAADKDTFGGMLDATAAGHLVAGESVADGVREAEEELGVAFDLADLEDLGERTVVDHPVPGMTNREFQHVFLVRDDRPLEAWTAFDREEVAGLAWLGVEDFTRLVFGGGAGPWAGREWDGHRVVPAPITRAELVPATYLRTLAIMVGRFARGERPLAI